MKYWLMWLVLLPLVTEGQALLRNETDVQSKKKVLETYPLTVIEASATRMAVTLRSADSSFFIQLAGSGMGANTIVADDSAILLLDNDSTVSVKSTTIQGYENNDSVKTYKHEYILHQEDLEILSRHPVQAIRKYSVIGFEDFYLGARDGVNLKALFAFFFAELGRSNLLTANTKRTAPAFPGGEEVYLSFLNRNVKTLPLLAAGTQKKALLQFQVSADGSISEVQVKQSAGALYDNELLRILKRMPKWKPALENGKPVNAVVAQTLNLYTEQKMIRIAF